MKIVWPDHDVEDVNSNLAHWPRFVVIETVSSDRPVTSLSPFAIAKALQGCIGTAKVVKKLRSRAILVELEKQKQSERLMGLKSMVDIPIKVSPHRSLNSCKGVVRSFDLAKMDKDELLAGLATQNVVDVWNISVTRNGEKQRTNTLIVTFAQATPPKEINAGYLKIPVQQYYPSPLRCFKCQKFGQIWPQVCLQACSYLCALRAGWAWCEPMRRSTKVC